MNITVKVCDKCKKEVRGDTQKEELAMFASIRFEFPAYGGSSVDRRYAYTSSYYEMCEECLAKVGIIAKPKETPHTEQEVKTLSEGLYDIMCELSQQVNQ